MNNNLILNSIFIFVFLWAVSLAFLWFRPHIDLFWKIIATLIFLIFLWLFKKEIMSGYAAFNADWYKSIIVFIRELMLLIFYNFFLFWPMTLIIIFYKADDIAAENLLKFICIFTLILSAVIWAYIFFHEGVDRFIYEKLINVVPFAK